MFGWTENVWFFHQVYYQDLHLLTHQHYLVQKPYQDLQSGLNKDCKLYNLITSIFWAQVAEWSLTVKGSRNLGQNNVVRRKLNKNKEESQPPHSKS